MTIVYEGDADEDHPAGRSAAAPGLAEDQGRGTEGAEERGESLAQRFNARAMLLRELPEVLECYAAAGEADYLLRIVVPDLQALEKFILEKLTRIPGIKNIKSSFALKQVKYKTALPLPADPR